MLKIYNERYSDFNSMIERYEREMREAYGLRRKINEDEEPIRGGTGTPAAEPEDISLETPAPPELEPVPFPEILSRPAPENAQSQIGAEAAPQPDSQTGQTPPMQQPQFMGRQMQPAPPQSMQMPRYVPQSVPERAETLLPEEMPQPFPVPATEKMPGGENQPPEELGELGQREKIQTRPLQENAEGKIYIGEGNTARSHVPIDSGYIIVSANSGRDAIPIAGVTVVIDRLDEHDHEGRQELVAVLTTNQSGRTEAVKVETVSRTLSQSPGDAGPFMTYYVSARHPGYYSVINRPVDVFGGETSLLELELVPLSEDHSGGNNNG